MHYLKTNYLKTNIKNIKKDIKKEMFNIVRKIVAGPKNRTIDE